MACSFSDERGFRSRRHRRRSRSRSPVAKPRVQYITSFGTSGGSAAGGLNRGAGEQLAFRMPGSDSQQGEPHRYVPLPRSWHPVLITPAFSA